MTSYSIMKQSPTILVYVGKKIRTLRESKQLSQEEFADKCGLDRTYISDIERGKRNVCLRNIDILATALTVTVSELFEGYNNLGQGQSPEIGKEYILRENFTIDCGFTVNSQDLYDAIQNTSAILQTLPFSLFQQIDFKATSGIIGSVFISCLSNQVGAIPNPIEKGHPDIIPKSGKDATEAQLRKYPKGLEIKCTIGNVQKGSQLRAGDRRIDRLNGITWQAHHREVNDLLGLIWDFAGAKYQDKQYPIITAAFYSDKLTTDDWGTVSGTSGRNTKVTGMNVSGKKKMVDGWMVIMDDPLYCQKYRKFLGYEEIKTPSGKSKK